MSAVILPHRAPTLLDTVRAARAAGIMSPDEEAAFLAGLQWIDAMRGACAGLIAAQDSSFASDTHWPECPANVVALAAKF